MLHARDDYQRIQDPAGLIAEDEPVFLLRGKDQLAPGIVRQWARELHRLAAHEEGERQEELLATARAAWAHAEKMEEWQRANGGAKVPDAPLVELSQDAAELGAGIELAADLERSERLAVVGKLTPMQLAELQATEREMRRKEQQAQMEEVTRRRGVAPQLEQQVPPPAEQQALEEGRDSGRAAE